MPGTTTLRLIRKNIFNFIILKMIFEPLPEFLKILIQSFRICHVFSICQSNPPHFFSVSDICINKLSKVLQGPINRLSIVFSCLPMLIISNFSSITTYISVLVDLLNSLALPRVCQNNVENIARPSNITPLQRSRNIFNSFYQSSSPPKTSKTPCTLLNHSAADKGIEKI